MPSPRVVVVGGGAAGFFAAITCAEARPEAEVILLEATDHLLAKVRISGGGRCNVTHACFDPRELVKRYPRGSRELLGPFSRFQPRDTIDWFAQRGVALKTEPDGRMFPTTDDSATIVDCLQGAAKELRVQVRTKSGLVNAQRVTSGAGFHLNLTSEQRLDCDKLILATGGNKASAGLATAASLGHTLEPSVPSLFTFNVTDPRIADLAGLAVPQATASVKSAKLRETGPILITHWGFSGPAILRLSAWGARALHACDYRFTLAINWLGSATADTARAALAGERAAHPKRQLSSGSPFNLPQRLWERLLTTSGIAAEITWANASGASLNKLVEELTGGQYTVTGKSTNKDEFVTCGGVRLKEVDFRTMESRLCPGLHFAGEVLDIDGITGGFNFQAAWTTARLAGLAAVGGAGSPG